MNEELWLSCDAPSQLLEYLTVYASARKLRLFAVACGRRIWHLLGRQESRVCIEMAESFADGIVGDSVRSNAMMTAVQARLEIMYGLPPEIAGGQQVVRAMGSALVSAASAAFEAASELAYSAAINCFRAASHAYSEAAWAEKKSKQSRNTRVSAAKLARMERQTQANLLREIFGNPFRPVTLDPRWQSSTVLDLARTIYEQRTFEHMPILADALMDAGCDSDEIIQHCQGPEPHVKGCWVVDLLTGRE